MPCRSPILALLLVAPLVGGATCGEPRTLIAPEAVRERSAPPPGHPVYAAVLESVTTRVDGETLAPDPEVTRSYARILRRASVFTEVEGPEASGQPGLARLRLLSDLAVDENVGGNMMRSVLIGASLTLLRPVIGYRFDARGTMELTILLPGAAEPLAHRAETRATQYYYRSGGYEAARQQVLQDVTTENMRRLVARLRLDPALTAAPEFERP